MASESVDNSLVSDDGVDDTKILSTPESYIEHIDDMCVQCLNAGMSYHDYWHGDPDMASYYYELYCLRLEQEQDKNNYYAWLQGLYYAKAIDVSTEIILKSITGKKGSLKSSYPDKPIEFKRKNRKEKELSYEVRAMKEIAQWQQLLS